MELEEAVRLAAAATTGQFAADEWAQTVVARATALLRSVAAAEAAEERVLSRRSLKAQVVGVVRRTTRKSGDPAGLGQVTFRTEVASKYAQPDGNESAWVDLSAPGAQALLDRASALIGHEAILELTTVAPDLEHKDKKYRYLTGITGVEPEPPVRAEGADQGVQVHADGASQGASDEGLPSPLSWLSGKEKPVVGWKSAKAMADAHNRLLRQHSEQGTLMSLASAVNNDGEGEWPMSPNVLDDVEKAAARAARARISTVRQIEEFTGELDANDISKLWRMVFGPDAVSPASLLDAPGSELVAVRDFVLEEAEPTEDAAGSR